VVLLDLRLPRLSGLEVLKAIRASRELQMVPVVVLTTSTAERDVVC
jgi:DNA-binding response OmpR family regulator